MGPSDEKSPTVAPPGRASEASESPGGAYDWVELLTGVWLAVFVDREQRRPLDVWMGHENYFAVQNLCSELARFRDGNEVGELLRSARGPEDQFAIWCDLIDLAPWSVKDRWERAVSACIAALDKPEAPPYPRFGGI